MFFNSWPSNTIHYPSSSLYATIPIRLQEANCHSVDHVGDIAPQPVVAEPPDATPVNAITRLGTHTRDEPLEFDSKTNAYYRRYSNISTKK